MFFSLNTVCSYVSNEIIISLQVDELFKLL